MSTLWRGEVAKVAEVPQDLEGFLHSLLEFGSVEALVCPKFLEDGKVAYALIPKGDTTNLAPLFPFTPANGEKVVSRLTLEGPMPGSTALAKLERLQGHGGGLWQMHWLSLLLPCMSHQLL